MQPTVLEEELRVLRQGNRVTYGGVEWQVSDYSTYSDREGYETEEWLLKSKLGKEYYLMREFAPAEIGATLQWYLAEELNRPQISDPATGKDLLYGLADEILSGQTPYPQVRALNRTYRFESQTEGSYESGSGDDGERTRITWDYWDEPHLWNLAFEVWPDRTLSVYSTRTVQPADFTNLQLTRAPIRDSIRSAAGSGLNKRVEQMMAIVLLVVGFILMIAGI